MIDKLIASLSASFDKESSVLLEVLAPVADALQVAQEGVTAALDQMAMTTADGEWLDEWGAYFGVPRLTGESDVEYGPRVVPEIIRPKANNVAIAKAIKEAFGQDAVVADVTAWDGVINSFSGSYSYNGAITYNDLSSVRYGLFDIESSYSLESGSDVAQFAANMRAFVDRFRAAGTQLRALSFVGSALRDDVAQSIDSASLVVTCNTYYDASHAYSGVIDHYGSRFCSGTLTTYYDASYAYLGVIDHHGTRAVAETLS